MLAASFVPIRSFPFAFLAPKPWLRKAGRRGYRLLERQLVADGRWSNYRELFSFFLLRTRFSHSGPHLLLLLPGNFVCMWEFGARRLLVYQVVLLPVQKWSPNVLLISCIERRTVMCRCPWSDIVFSLLGALLTEHRFFLSMASQTGFIQWASQPAFAYDFLVISQSFIKINQPLVSARACPWERKCRRFAECGIIAVVTLIP